MCEWVRLKSHFWELQNSDKVVGWEGAELVFVTTCKAIFGGKGGKNTLRIDANGKFLHGPLGKMQC